jgi:hypothetical protein
MPRNATAQKLLIQGENCIKTDLKEEFWQFELNSTKRESDELPALGVGVVIFRVSIPGTVDRCESV